MISQIKALKDDNRQFRSILDEKIKEIEPLQQALGKLRNANSANRGVCSSEEELNSLVCLNPNCHSCEFLNLFLNCCNSLLSFGLSNIVPLETDP